MSSLGSPVGDLANLAFGLIGIWMAHSLYRTTRKRWQAVVAWVMIFIVWSFGTNVLKLVLPAVPYVRLSMCIGFTGILVYLYLFQNIPVQQRVFTYFMVDTSMTLTVLLARTLSVLLAQTLDLNGDGVFLALYIPITIVFLVLFRRYLRDYILNALAMFRRHLTILAVFAAVCYVTLLLIVDPWAPWPPLDGWTATAWLGMIVFVCTCYVLAFRTLLSIRDQTSAEHASAQLTAQLSLSEQYYDTLVEQIEQTRVYHHDLRHHINALAGLCADGQLEEISRYIAAMGQALPESLGARYCKVGAVNALLEHYAEHCRGREIEFPCEVRIPADTGIQPLHLCVVFGNALQNALEAVLRMEPSAAPFIEVKAAVAEGRLAISVRNPCAKEPESDGSGGYRTSKEGPGHGLGLTSIRETARQYGGWCGGEWAEGVFTLRVILNCKTVT